jgi:hypothetical protein
MANPGLMWRFTGRGHPFRPLQSPGLNHKFIAAGGSGLHIGSGRYGVALGVLVTFQAEHTVAGLDCRHHLPSKVAFQLP